MRAHRTRRVKGPRQTSSGALDSRTYVLLPWAPRLETARRLATCTDTKAALLNGDISVAAATEITQTEAEAPGAEAVLLPHALTCDLTTRREKAHDCRQKKATPEDLHRQQQKARFFRHWKDRLGMICFTGALPPEAGLPLVRRIELAACRSRHRSSVGTPSCPPCCTTACRSSRSGASVAPYPSNCAAPSISGRYRSSRAAGVPIAAGAGVSSTTTSTRSPVTGPLLRQPRGPVLDRPPDQDRE